MTRKSQTAYENSIVLSNAESLETVVESTMYSYLRNDLGWPKSVAAARAAMEVAGSLAIAVCDECEKAGLCFDGNRVLDLGAGLGGLAVEMAKRGANVVAIEPGAAWRKVAAARLAAAGQGMIVGAVGEHLPLEDNSVDLVVSLQVLEHVQNPSLVIREAFRVLKPGGYIYIAYENYLSFWEPHYRVRWLPLLPKSIGGVYLKMIGRNPQFLKESITYTIFPVVRRALLQAGFECHRMQEYQRALRSPQKISVKWKLMKALSSVNLLLPLRLIMAFDYSRRLFRTFTEEVMQKPSKTAIDRPTTN
jgi:2-polyprenyl-3-methyl-5-hydroxy-6-metoxy-1,4-benzoquinol methylase